MSTSLDKTLIVYFRLAMGWTFLYAGVTQLADPGWSVVGFLGGTKTFHDVLAPFAAPAVATYVTFLVEWGHLLIGLSLISGVLVRLSASFGIMLMLVYYMAHMDFPYVESKLNFLMDYHLVYAGVLIYLIARRAGHVWGLDGWAERLPIFQRHPILRPLVA
jgi:thiosulfate dehydrogenase [quinone] large subunit